MELIKKHIDDDSDTGILGFDCTVRLSGHEIDLIRLALIMFVEPEKNRILIGDKKDAKKLYDELITQC